MFFFQTGVFVVELTSEGGLERGVEEGLGKG